MKILDRQGLSVSAIARQLGLDRTTVRKYVARGLEPPAYMPRPPRERRLDAFTGYLRERVATYPAPTGSRLWREIKGLGYPGGYTAVADYLRDVHPTKLAPFEVRFETPPGHRAQVDFAQFKVSLTNETSATRAVWLFSMVLGRSRHLWAGLVMHHDLQRTSAVRCHQPAASVVGSGRYSRSW